MAKAFITIDDSDDKMLNVNLRLEGGPILPNEDNRPTAHKIAMSIILGLDAAEKKAEQGASCK